MASKKNVTESIRLYEAAGYTVQKDGAHYKVFSRDGLWVDTISSSTALSRVVKAHRAQLRRLQRGDYSRVPGRTAAERNMPEATAQPEQEQRGGRVPSAFLPREKLATSAAISVRPPRAANWAPAQRDKSAANWARHQARRDAEREDREKERLTITVECAGCGRPVRVMGSRFSLVQAESRHILGSWCHFAGVDAFPRKLPGLPGWNVPLFWCQSCSPDSATEYRDLGKGVLDARELTVWKVTDPRTGQELRDMFEQHLLDTFLPILTGKSRRKER